MITFIYKDENGNIGMIEDLNPIELCNEVGWEFMREIE